MAECDYCGEEFDDEQELHLHLGEEHEDEMNSHEKDKFKKARRKREEQREAERNRKKKLAGWGFAGIMGLAFVVFVGSQLLSMSPGEAKFDLEEHTFMGSENASVTVVSFGDYLCPYCQQYETQSKPKIIDEYVDEGDVKYYHIDLPLRMHEPQASNAAVAAKCVSRQDEEEYWKYHDALFENQEQIEYNTEGLVGLANETTTGLDLNQLETCVEERKTADKIKRDRQIARENSVTSTPTVFVNGKETNWAYSNLKEAIEKELQ